MRTVELDEDVYQHLLQQTSYIGENASSILRRLLGLGQPDVEQATSNSAKASSDAPAQQQDDESVGLLEFLRSTRFQSHRNATDRYLEVLSFAHERNPQAFERILQLSGRRRTYFGDSHQAIEKSGKSTHPRQIPGTRFWAMTNADTGQKQEILTRALKLVGYTPAVAREAARMLGS